MPIVAIHLATICVYLLHFCEKLARIVEWMWPNRPRFVTTQRYSFTQFCKFKPTDHNESPEFNSVCVGPLKLGKHLNLFSICSVGNIFNLVYLDYKRHYIYDRHSRHAGQQILKKLINRSLVFWLTEKLNKYKEIIWVTDIFFTLIHTPHSLSLSKWTFKQKLRI